MTRCRNGLGRNQRQPTVMNDSLVLDSHGEADTDRFGQALADSVNDGLVIALNGQLGSGKTRFVRSLCFGLGIDTQHVNSPTFVLMQLYTDGRIPVAHLDTYRIGDTEEFLAIGAESYLFDDGWLSLIEWADRVADALPADRLTVSIEHLSPTSRRFEFSASGPGSTALLMRLRQQALLTQAPATEPTPEMLARYERRTHEHIERVRRCLLLLAMDSEHAAELAERASTHDASKFSLEERIPYVWLTEFHRCRRTGDPFQYPDGVLQMVTEAINHHFRSNRHHPEFHAVPDDMSDVDLIEMVCDWTAMAQEFSEDGRSARGWADKTIGKRIEFSKDKQQFIYQIIDRLDGLFRVTEREGGCR